MNNSVPSSITIEEAVAWLMNIDYLPPGHTLLEMTAAFQEEAEVEYENAKLDRLPEGKLTTLKDRVEACQARHIQAESLLRHIQEELAHPDNSLLVVSSDSSSMTRLELESVADWASYKYGIGIPDWYGIEISKPNTVTEVPVVDHPPTEKILPDGSLGPKKANSLYTTFAFLLEAFVKASESKRYGSSEKLTVTAIAKHLSELAETPNGPGADQGIESIKGRIEEAQRRKSAYLKNR